MCPADRQDRSVADVRRRRQRRLFVVTHLAYALVVAEVVAATWSLVAGDPWDWSRFWWIFLLVLISAVMASAAEAVAERSGVASQRRSAEDDETAHAVRTGLLPADADPETWRVRIRRHSRQGAVIATAGTALCVAAAVLTAAAAHLHSDDDPVLLTLAVAALLLLAPLVRLMVRDRRRARRLLSRL
jgi:peptidoglycan/LPS O-acetylase OafA/YrhL